MILEFLNNIPDKDLTFEKVYLNKFFFKTPQGKRIFIFASGAEKKELLAFLKKGEVYNKS